MMTIDEEIRLVKEEKELNKKVNELMESLEISDDVETRLLTLKYCETAEMLREFDYKKNIFESYKESRDYKKINELNEAVSLANEKIHSTDINIVTEGYRELAKVYISLKEDKYIDRHSQRQNFTGEQIKGMYDTLDKFYREGGEDNHKSLRRDYKLRSNQIDAYQVRRHNEEQKGK